MTRITAKISPRLLRIVEALPLKQGMRVLEIGCGPGAAAREIAARIGDGYVLAIDRSAKAIEQAVRSSAAEMKAGRLNFRLSAIEDFDLKPDEPLFDIAFAVRVGAFDGRHPELEQQALAQVGKVLKPDGKFFIEKDDVLKELNLNL